MRTLIFCPTYRLEPETVDAIMRLKIAGSGDVLFTRQPATGDERADVLSVYQFARRMALWDEYDALLTVESDVIPPADALLKLAACDRPIAYGSYILRRGTPVLNLRYCVRGVKPTGIGPDLAQVPGFLAEAWGQVIPTSGVGLGCTLIRRPVLEAIEFRNGAHSHCDWWFAIDAMRAGFEQVGHLDVLCGHKRPDGLIMWPQLGESGWQLVEGNPDRSYWTEAAQCQLPA